MRSTEVRVDRFVVVRRLGRGGMGAVYEGYDPALDRRVAIKTLTTDAIADDDSRNRFEREARAAAKLQHPNIVTIYELGNFGGKEKPYIVMEYLEGTDLAALIDQEKGIPLSEALEIAIQLCRGLGYAHEKGVVHRDVKPSNVRYLDDGRLKIMDFGIARVEGTAQITRSGVMVGTIHYMSPEQIQGDTIDGRSDIFSSGCILYEMLTGRRPFTGESPSSILYKIVHQEPAPVLVEHPEVPQEVQDVLNRALAKNPGDRFRNAGEMARELEKLLEVCRKVLTRSSPELDRRLGKLAALRKEGRWAELVPLAQKLAQEHPELAEPRRALRQALRELRREETERQAGREEKTRHLEEISREFQMLYGPTTLTELSPTPAPVASAVPAAGEEPRLRSRTGPPWRLVGGMPGWALALAGLLAGVLTAGVWWWIFSEEDSEGRDISHSLHIGSSPSGASIFVDGRPTGLTTDADLPVKGVEGQQLEVELQRVGFASARARLILSAAAPPAPLHFDLQPLGRKVTISSEPSGAQVSLDGRALSGVTPLEVELSSGGKHLLVLNKQGYASRTVEIPAGGEIPAKLTLSPLGEPGTLLVRSGYPLAILSGGRTLAEGSGPLSLKLRPGRQEVTLYAPAVFLSRTLPVDIQEKETTVVEAPPLGKLSVRAYPENCTLTVDGITSETPPYDDKPIAAGIHRFEFEWRDGRRQVESRAVAPGQRVYLIGRAR